MDEYDDAVTALVGGASGDSGGELSALVLEMSCATVKLATLLQEADEREWRAVQPRLKTLRSLLGQLPDKPAPRRAVGFKLKARGSKSGSRAS